MEIICALPFKSLGSVEEILTYILQGCIDLTKSKRKGFYIVTEDFHFNAVLLNFLFIKECWENVS